MSWDTIIGGVAGGIFGTILFKLICWLWNLDK